MCPFKTCVGDLDLEECIADYERLDEKEKERFGYERDLLRVLEGLVRQVVKSKEYFNFEILFYFISLSRCSYI